MITDTDTLPILEAPEAWTNLASPQAFRYWDVPKDFDPWLTWELQLTRNFGTALCKWKNVKNRASARSIQQKHQKAVSLVLAEAFTRILLAQR